MESADLVKLSDIQTVPANVCVKGFLNVDGACVHGGNVDPTASYGPNPSESALRRASAYPASTVYFSSYLPYATSWVSGPDFHKMNTWSEGTKLLRPYP